MQKREFQRGAAERSAPAGTRLAADPGAGFLNRRGSARSADLQGGRLILVPPAPRQPTCEIRSHSAAARE